MERNRQWRLQTGRDKQEELKNKIKERISEKDIE